MNKKKVCPNEGDKLIDTFVANYRSYLEEPSKSLLEVASLSFLDFDEYWSTNPMPTKFYTCKVGDVNKYITLTEKLDSIDEMMAAMNCLFDLVTKNDKYYEE